MALRSLIGHENIYRSDDPSVRVEVVERRLGLVVAAKKGGGHELRLSATPTSGVSVEVEFETPSRIVVTHFDPSQQALAEVIGGGVSIPARAADRLRAVIEKLAGTLTVESDLDAGVSAESVERDPRAHMHLRPRGEGLEAVLRFHPLGADGPAWRAGEGGTNVVADIGGRRVQTARDLADESRRAAALMRACPSLEMGDAGDEHWTIAEPVDCLELVLSLRELGDEVVTIWPEGCPFSLRGRVDSTSMKVAVRGRRDWFHVEGEIAIDEELTLNMRALLDALDARRGRFVRLEDGQWLALTESLRKRLEAMRAYAEPTADGLRFRGVAALAIDEALGDAGDVTVSDTYKKLRRRLAKARAFQPVVPSTFQAEMRDYQRDGFDWLSRLAVWGVGACLADDMGLGKTIQALAILLTRAADGPSIVVAPTSVGHNWALETQRFAPTLNTVIFGPGDRDATLAALGPYDVLIVSYGLLPLEIERLAGVSWRVAVLDEAQAIKNPATQPAKAAMQLDADFRLATTGTPIENHLGELWSLFRFLNPGLLGARERFDRTFARPIERGTGPEADPVAIEEARATRARLKKLVQPFILRRTKHQVLDELPPRTDITLRIELSDPERALYEAQRQRAIERLTAPDDGDGAGARHLKILAELMRLRQMCCHPRLVHPDSPLPSAKLEALEGLVDELLDNRHKALIFSQFIGHLAVVRERLDAKGIRYQYLDGQTPANARARAVAAFQRGEGDIFLISLRAGGLGLNLTAADYVVHLDPWWNPAVEDQASDRAHRIGQTRPVTVYRLVARATIEEQIVSLHGEKRHLAESLLEGTDTAARLDADALLALIRTDG